MILKSGDVLLYGPSSTFGWLIALKTWHTYSHVEVYIGNSQSVASRDGEGVNLYSVRTDHLRAVCRPRAPFNLDAALRYFGSVKGQPYGWWDLARFLGAPVNGPGMVCSGFATEFVRAGGLDPFNGEDSTAIAPFQFAVSPLYAVLPATGVEG